MEIAGRTLPNPDEGGLQIEQFYTTIQGESILGLTTNPIYYRPPSGSPYLRPKHLLRLQWSDLVATERQQLELAANALATSFGILRMTGLGITRYDPPQLGGATETDSAYVLVAPGSNLAFTFSQGFRQVGGTVYGPVLYAAQLTLWAGDIRYLYDN